MEPFFNVFLFKKHPKFFIVVNKYDLLFFFVLFTLELLKSLLVCLNLGFELIFLKG